jgi:SET domain
MPLVPPAIYIKDTGTARGRGAFAARRFSSGDVVESCPVVLFHGKASAVPGEVRRLLFNWSVLANTLSTHCLALGYGSLYNHDNPASMRYEADVPGQLMHFIATREIATDEELTVNYNARGGGHLSLDDSWFRGQGVDRI